MAYERMPRILDAAAELIAVYGYDKTTVKDIAGQAGFTKATVYLDFASKEELFTALLRRQMRRVLDDVTARVQTDPDGGVIGAIYQHVLLALAGDPLMRALYTQDTRVLGRWALQQPHQRYAQRFDVGRAFVVRMQQAGLIRRDLDADAVTSLLSAWSVGMFGLGADTGKNALPLEDLSGPLADVVQRGFGADDGDSRAGKTALRTLINELYRQYAGEENNTDGYDRI